MEAEAAMYWMSLVRFGQLIAAFLVAIGVVAEFAGEYLSRSLERPIEAAREERLATLMAEAASARAAIAEANMRAAEANERAAEANKKAEAEKLERIKTEQEFLKQLRPRSLDKEQFDIFVSTIKGKIKELAVYTLTDDEASRFGFVILDALQKADVIIHWTPPAAPTELFMVTGIPTAGVILYVPDVGDDPEKKKLVATFLEAAGKGGISDALVLTTDKPLSSIPAVPSLFIAKKQRPFNWIPGYLLPPEFPKPPWESK
jgi:hypothetical protein